MHPTRGFGELDEQVLRRRLDAIERQIQERLGTSIDTAQGAMQTVGAVISLASALGVPRDRWGDASAWKDALQHCVLHWIGHGAAPDADDALHKAREACDGLRQEAARLTRELSLLDGRLQKMEAEVSRSGEQLEGLRGEVDALTGELGRAEAVLQDLEQRVAAMEAIARALAETPSGSEG